MSIEKEIKLYKCRTCGQVYSKENYAHCPNCLSSVHTDEECNGTLEPVGIWVKPNDSWEIILRCRLCGEITTSLLHKDDNPVKVMSIAAKPLSMPPFPIERMKEMTDLMGGNGDIEGYYYEQRKQEKNA